MKTTDIQAFYKTLPASLSSKWFDEHHKDLTSRSCIYFIICAADLSFYIGSAADARNRFSKHRLAFKNIHHSRHLQMVYDKYGLTGLEFRIVEYVPKTRDGLLATEQRYIDAYHPTLNINPVAGSNLGRKFSEETRQKIRVANLGKKLTPENRAIAIKNLRRTPFGRKHSAETKAKMSATRKLNPPKGMLGKKRSPEAIAKTAKAHRKVYVFFDPVGNKVCVDNLPDHCNAEGLSRSHMTAVNSGARKSHKGWTSAGVIHTKEEIAKVEALLKMEVS